MQIVQVIEELLKIKDSKSGEKAIIVSQWTSMLLIVKDHLQNVGIRCHSISGQVLVKDRPAIVEDFNNNARGPKVCCLL